MPAAPVSTPRILAVRFGSIGDILLITPLLRALRHRHPGAVLEALTKRVHAPLLADNPHLDEVLTLVPGRRLASLARELRSRRYTHLLDLHGTVRSRVLRLLVPGRWTGYRKRKVARELLIHTKRSHYGKEVPVAERDVEAARDLDVRPDSGPCEFFLSAEAVQRADQWLREGRLGADRPLVALAPGAAHFTKRWPARHWQSAVARLVEQELDVVIVGGPDDIAICREIAASGGSRTVSAAGTFGLQETGALLQRARAVLSGDTGLMHMATAVGTPVVAIFGPTVHAFGFSPYHADALVLERELPCRPCSSKGGPRCPLGHHRCMEEILPEQAVASLRGLWRTI